jgi:membrane associated rhomboid family serine protease
VPVVRRALIVIRAVVFFFELMGPRQSLEEVFYLFEIVPVRFIHPVAISLLLAGGLAELLLAFLMVAATLPEIQPL